MKAAPNIHKFFQCALDYGLSLLWIPLKMPPVPKKLKTRRDSHMALQTPEQETLNVKLVHFTKQNSPDEPVQVAFSLVDDQGTEEIITRKLPYIYDLFTVFLEQAVLTPACCLST